MWEFVQANGTAIVLLLMLLACPLMHAFGHHGRSHRHGPPSEPDQR